MISIIICSRQKSIPESLYKNVEETIGADHEWVFIDNSDQSLSIFKAYNFGVARAQGDILCFMHDDIAFRSSRWGESVNNAFQNKSLGLLGVIGNHVIPACPASWWTACYEAGHVVQHYEQGDRYETLDYLAGASNQVALVDGLWFCVPRRLFPKIHFDEQTYQGFHCYDSDICMQVLKQGLDIALAEDIVIQHNSDGTLSPQFFEQRQLWFNKWRHHLPLCRGIELSPNELNIITQMAERENRWTLEASLAQQEAHRLRATHAYRLGKTLLCPFHFLKRK